LLRTQLLKWLAVPLAVLFIADTVASYWTALRLANRAYDRALLEIAKEVSLHVRIGSYGETSLDVPESALGVLFRDPTDVIYHQVASPDGKLVSGTPLPHGEFDATVQEKLYDATIGDRDIRVAELRVGDDPMTQSGVIVRVAETTLRRRMLARDILMSILAPQVALIAMAGLIVWLGIVHGLRPLVKIRDAVTSRSPNDISEIHVAGVPGELRPLLEAMNCLLVRIGDLLSLQRRFIADAAHQLKTPVAALLAHAELAARAEQPGEIREQVRSLDRGLQRLSRLMSQLLALARNEPDAARTVSFLPLDINALALEVCSEWVAEAVKRNIDLGFEGDDEPIVIKGDAGRLRELLDNLVDNAVRYTTSGGRVTVRVERAPRPAIRVADDGPHIPPEERGRIFERFHRVLGTPGEGSGLGLAIAREIATLHGAEILLAPDTDGIGNVFSVIFPSARQTRTASGAKETATH